MLERHLSFARVVVLLLLAVGASCGWGNFRLSYLQAPGLVLLVTLVALAVYVPSVWGIYRLGRPHRLWRHKLFSFLFVTLFVTISPRWTQDAIDAGIPYLAASP